MGYLLITNQYGGPQIECYPDPEVSMDMSSIELSLFPSPPHLWDLGEPIIFETKEKAIQYCELMINCTKVKVTKWNF